MILLCRPVNLHQAFWNISKEILNVVQSPAGSISSFLIQVFQMWWWKIRCFYKSLHLNASIHTRPLKYIMDCLIYVCLFHWWLFYQIKWEIKLRDLFCFNIYIFLFFSKKLKSCIHNLWFGPQKIWLWNWLSLWDDCIWDVFFISILVWWY